MNNKRILFIASYSGLMGANLSMLQLMIELKKMGHTPLLLIPCEGLLSNELKKNNIEYVTSLFFLSLCDTSSIICWAKGLIRVLINPVFYLFAYAKVRYKFNKIDIIHSNSSVIHIGEFFNLISGIKHVKHLREFGSIDYNLNYALGKWLQKKINNWFVNQNIAISDSINKHYTKIGFKNIITIYNGISDDRIYKKNICEKRDYTNIICIGVINEKKNQKQVVESVISIIENTPQKICLYLLGGDNSIYAESLKRYVIEHNAEKYVIFCGYKKDISTEISNADIAVVPSLNEAFGRVTIEYMLNHIPVIVSNKGANVELVENHISGLVYNIENTSSLEKCILRLCEDYPLRYKLSDAAYNFAKCKYTSLVNAKCISDIYDKTEKI